MQDVSIIYNVKDLEAVLEDYGIDHQVVSDTIIQVRNRDLNDLDLMFTISEALIYAKK
jgi:hypothetical protein